MIPVSDLSLLPPRSPASPFSEHPGSDRKYRPMLHQNMAIRRKRFQPWPFYRRTYFDAEMQAEVEELWRKMEEGYDPHEDPGSPLHRGNVRSYISTLARPNYGSTRYSLRETPDYLRGRDGTAERGCDLEDLDFIVAKLLRGERLARESADKIIFAEEAAFGAMTESEREMFLILMGRFVRALRDEIQEIKREETEA